MDTPELRGGYLTHAPRSSAADRIYALRSVLLVMIVVGGIAAGLGAWQLSHTPIEQVDAVGIVADIGGNGAATITPPPAAAPLPIAAPAPPPVATAPRPVRAWRAAPAPQAAKTAPAAIRATVEPAPEPVQPDEPNAAKPSDDPTPPERGIGRILPLEHL